MYVEWRKIYNYLDWNTSFPLKSSNKSKTLCLVFLQRMPRSVASFHSTRSICGLLDQFKTLIQSYHHILCYAEYIYSSTCTCNLNL
jgi:hypothetical protein